MPWSAILVWFSAAQWENIPLIKHQKWIFHFHLFIAVPRHSQAKKNLVRLKGLPFVSIWLLFYRNSNRNLLFLIVCSVRYRSESLFTFYEQFDSAGILIRAQVNRNQKKRIASKTSKQSSDYHIFHCLLLNALRIVKRIIFDKRWNEVEELRIKSEQHDG